MLIAWATQRETSVIPKSSSDARIKTNADLITLTDEEMKVLDEKHKDSDNPQRVPKGESKNKDCMGWSFSELGWDSREDM